MEKITRLPFSTTVKTYLSITKPGIVFGNLVTAIAGFALATQGSLNPLLFLHMALALSCIIASACVFNNFIDRKLDAKMKRTRNRALVKGLISNQNALIFATLIGAFGFFEMAYYVNLLCTQIALFGFLVYVLLYSFSKYSTIHCTLIGSFAGAVPPLVGYCAITHALDAKALLFFILVATWQMPHFFAIAIFRMKDYIAGKIPLLPIKKGIFITKVVMLLNIVALIFTATVMTLMHYTGMLFFFVSLLLGLGWLILNIRGFRCKNDTMWARQMFLFSLVVIMGLSTALIFNS